VPIIRQARLLCSHTLVFASTPPESIVSLKHRHFLQQFLIFYCFCSCYNTRELICLYFFRFIVAQFRRTLAVHSILAYLHINLAIYACKSQDIDYHASLIIACSLWIIPIRSFLVFRDHVFEDTSRVKELDVSLHHSKNTFQPFTS
jgi:hypothetical protein